MKPAVSGILSGILAAAALLVFLFVIKAGLLISLIAGVLVYIGGTLIFAVTEKKLQFVAEGVTKEDAEQTIRDGRAKVDSIKKTNDGIKDQKVNAQINELCELASKIFDDLERDPKGVKNARKFLTYYLDTTAYIVSRYAELSSGACYSDEVKTALAKVEDSLTLIQETFKQQIGRLMQADVSDLDIELELLKKTIKTEGI